MQAHTNHLRYHRDIYLPVALAAQAQRTVEAYRTTFRLTHHARERAMEKGVLMPTALPEQGIDLIEVSCLPGTNEFWACLIRFDHGDGVNDLCLVLSHQGAVITWFLNEKRDSHRTLNPRVYQRRP